MANIGMTELLLMVPGCIFSVACVVGAILGAIAFFKVRRLERRLKQNQQ